MAHLLVVVSFFGWLATAPVLQEQRPEQVRPQPPVTQEPAATRPDAGAPAAEKNAKKPEANKVAATQGLAAPAPATTAPELPPLPDGVTELKFADIFAPVGPRGLEFTAKARELEGKRVRILGYMVKTCRHDHGRFLLTPFPITLHDHEMGPADDLPPSTLFVDVPPFRRALKYIPHEPGLFLLTGKLSLGGRDELHGRRSWVRLELERPGQGPGEPVPAEEAAKGAAPVIRERVLGVDTEPVPALPQPGTAPTGQASSPTAGSTRHN